MIDLTTPTKTFVVSTTKGGYMGPDIKINAHNATDAAERVKQAGYTPNSYFPPEEVKR
jgi:hypothetical protein